MLPRLADVCRFVLVLLAWAPVGALAQDAFTLPQGASVTGELSVASERLTSGEYVAYYTVESDGTPFEARLVSNEFDPYLIAQAPSGARYYNDDFREAHTESRVIVTDAAVEAGVWIIGVTTYQPEERGSFVLAHRALSPEEAEALAVALPRQGDSLTPDSTALGALTARSDSLGSGEHVEFFAMDLGGEPFEILLMSSDFDTYLIVQSPSGERHDNDDDGTTARSRVVIGPADAEAGRWMLGVTTYAPGETGRFRLSHRTLSDEEARLLTEAASEAADRSVLDQASSLHGQALVLQEQGRPGDAEALAREALAIRERTLGHTHPTVATSLVTLAGTLRDQGESEAARSLYERALHIQEASLGPTHTSIATSLTHLALLLQAEGDSAAAQPLYLRAVEILEPGTTANERAALATALYNYASLYVAQGDYAQAREIYARALEIEEEALGPEHPEVAVTLAALGDAARADGDLGAAASLLHRALSIQESALGADHIATARPLFSLGELAVAQGAYANARGAYERALATTESALGPAHPDAAIILNALGELVQLESFDRAQPMYEAALDSQEAALPSDDPALSRTRNNLARLVRAREDLRTQRPLTPTRGPDVEVAETSPVENEGPYRALLFATNRYDDPGFSDLVNPIPDAEAIAAELYDRFGFDTTVVRNPSREEIYGALGQAAREDRGQNSQTLVFFAGHGTYRGLGERGLGYIIPRDARVGDRSSWFSYAELAPELDLLPDQRVLLLLDVCYGGAFVKRARAAGEDLYRTLTPAELVAKYAPFETRLVLTSGSKEYVSDGAPGQHSPFAYHLLRALRSGGGPDGDGLLLFSEMVRYAQDVAGPTPLSGGFGKYDPNGSFFFWEAAPDG